MTHKFWNYFGTTLGLVCFTALLSGGVVLAINTVATGYRTTTTNQSVNAHGVCQNVRHTSGPAAFVPTKTAGEWSSFRAGKPASVALSACGQWYQATYYVGQAIYINSCSTVCANQGKSKTPDVKGNYCASGEVRPGSVSGISYVFGTWGPFEDESDSADVNSGSIAHYCYTPGQHRDNDYTDQLVGCHCG